MQALRRHPAGVASSRWPSRSRSRGWTLRTLAVTTALVSALLGAGSARAQEPATLQGEELHQFGTFFNPQLFQVSGDCNPAGISTLSFTVTDAVASGPYPGFMDGSGSASIGPQILPPQTQSGFPITAVGELTQFEEDFTVTSGDTTISGTKDLAEIAGNPISEGACIMAPDGTTTWYFFANTAYDAVITTPTGQFGDSGLSYAEIQPIYDQQNTIVAAGFSEFFVLSNGIAPFTTPGHATGGGQIGPGLTFDFTAYSKDDGTIVGGCNVVGPAIHIRCNDVTQYSQTGNHATFAGTADVDGCSTTYRIDVQDNADPGVGTDTFTITTACGFSATGVLTQGNIQVHQ
jgi:hypothetical protein